MPKLKRKKNSSLQSLRRKESRRKSQDTLTFVQIMTEDAKLVSTYQRRKLAALLLEYLKSQYDRRRLVLHSIRLVSTDVSPKTYALCLFQIKEHSFSVQTALRLKQGS